MNYAQKIIKLLEAVHGAKEDPKDRVQAHIVAIFKALNSGEITPEQAHRSISASIAFHDLNPSQLHAIHQHLEENPLEHQSKETSAVQEVLENFKAFVQHPLARVAGKIALAGAAGLGAYHLAGTGIHIGGLHTAGAGLGQIGQVASAATAGSAVSANLNKPKDVSRIGHTLKTIGKSLAIAGTGLAAGGAASAYGASSLGSGVARGAASFTAARALYKRKPQSLPSSQTTSETAMPSYIQGEEPHEQQAAQETQHLPSQHLGARKRELKPGFSQKNYHHDYTKDMEGRKL